MRLSLAAVIRCLLLGAVVNVGVAWTLAATVRTEGLDDWEGLGWIACEPSSPYRGWTTMSLVGLGSSRVVTEAYSRDVMGTIFPPVSLQPDEVIPDWAAAIHKPPLDFVPAETNRKVRVHDARGWPMVALYSCYDATPDRSYQWRIVSVINGIRIDRTNPVNNSEASDQRLFPLRPIWPGVIINTLFYGVLLWLVVPGPLALCRLLRTRRGLCMKCAYPIGAGAVCTECGAAVTPR